MCGCDRSISQTYVLSMHMIFNVVLQYFYIDDLNVLRYRSTHEDPSLAWRILVLLYCCPQKIHH